MEEATFWSAGTLRNLESKSPPSSHQALEMEELWDYVWRVKLFPKEATGDKGQTGAATFLLTPNRTEDTPRPWEWERLER